MPTDLPLPRLVTKLPRYEGGIKPMVSIKIGRRGRKNVRSADGQPLIRVAAGGPVAEWEVPGMPGTFGSRRGAMIERSKAKRRA